MWWLFLLIIFVGQVREVVAQVREDAEVLLAPALEVFAGSGTSGEFFWVGVAVVGGGLVVALVAAHVMWLVQRITVSVLVRFLGAWMVVSLGVSAVGLSWYVSQHELRTLVEADVRVQPKDIRVQRVGNQLAVRWRTEEPTLGQVVFRTNMRIDERIRMMSSIKVFEHDVRIELVEGEKEMWVSILSNGVEYREDGMELWVGL